ncbi:MAG: elongation factor 1-beta [Candidatus Micrarchaeota archaeon]
MGKVMTIIKVFPEDMEKFEQIKEEIRKKFNPKDMKEEPVAFGFKILKVGIVSEDKEGSGNVEEELKKISGVSEVQVEDVTLVS